MAHNTVLTQREVLTMVKFQRNMLPRVNRVFESLGTIDYLRRPLGGLGRMGGVCNRESNEREQSQESKRPTPDPRGALPR